MSSETVENPSSQSNTRLRNRLVGSIILVAAAVIIIPSVLDGRKLSYKDDFKKVPDSGEFQSVTSAKTFPKKEFEQHMPQTSESITDEVPVDADELIAAVEQSKEVFENETIAINTIAKPVDFDQPADHTQTANNSKDYDVRNSKDKALNAPVSEATANKVTTSDASPFSGSAWVIQLGVFGKKANVTALEKKLNDAGFVTFNRDLKTRSGSTLTKVYVGPELERARLTKALSQVNKVSGLNGKITQFVINP